MKGAPSVLWTCDHCGGTESVLETSGGPDGWQRVAAHPLKGHASPEDYEGDWCSTCVKILSPIRSGMPDEAPPVSPERVTVEIALSSSGFTSAMQRVAAEVGRMLAKLAEYPRLNAYLAHQARHHRREVPVASALHVAYDRRRRARRRRR